MADPGTAGSPLVAVTAAAGAAGGLPVAAAVGIAAARATPRPRGIVLCETGSTARRPTLISSQAARELESRLRGAVPVAARGALCWASLGDEWRAGLEDCRQAGAEVVVAFVAPDRWHDLVADPGAGVRAAVVRADLPHGRPLAGLVAIELRAGGLPAGIVTRAPGVVASRRAVAGIDPGGTLGARANRLVRRLLGPGRREGGQALPHGPGPGAAPGPRGPVSRPPWGRRHRRLAPAARRRSRRGLGRALAPRRPPPAVRPRPDGHRPAERRASDRGRVPGPGRGRGAGGGARERPGRRRSTRLVPRLGLRPDPRPGGGGRPRRGGARAPGPSARGRLPSPRPIRRRHRSGRRRRARDRRRLLGASRLPPGPADAPRRGHRVRPARGGREPSGARACR